MSIIKIYLKYDEKTLGNNKETISFAFLLVNIQAKTNQKVYSLCVVWPLVGLFASLNWYVETLTCTCNKVLKVISKV